jgi:hypothetical protein
LVKVLEMRMVIFSLVEVLELERVILGASISSSLVGSYSQISLSSCCSP